MRRRRFTISHSAMGVVGLLVVEALIVFIVPPIGTFALLLAAIVGGVGIVVIATEIVEEVRNSRNMLILLSATVVEFIVFFAFQYHFILHLDPNSFQNLVAEPISLLLQSTMVFALNPLYLPASVAGKALLLINTLESLVLALFVLQNIWQLHRNK
jgi:hypothetical protein